MSENALTCNDRHTQYPDYLNGLTVSFNRLERELRSDVPLYNHLVHVQNVSRFVLGAI